MRLSTPEDFEDDCSRMSVDELSNKFHQLMRKKAFGLALKVADALRDKSKNDDGESASALMTLVDLYEKFQDYPIATDILFKLYDFPPLAQWDVFQALVEADRHCPFTAKVVLNAEWGAVDCMKALAMVYEHDLDIFEDDLPVLTDLLRAVDLGAVSHEVLVVVLNLLVDQWDVASEPIFTKLQTFAVTNKEQVKAALADDQCRVPDDPNTVSSAFGALVRSLKEGENA